MQLVSEQTSALRPNKGHSPAMLLFPKADFEDVGDPVSRTHHICGARSLLCHATGRSLVG